MLLADFDPLVAEVWEQPFRLTTVVNGRRRALIPDFFLVGPSVEVTVVNVKPACRLADDRVVQRLAWPSHPITGRGRTYEVWPGCDPVVLENIRFLAGYRRTMVVLIETARTAAESVVDGEQPTRPLDRHLLGSKSMARSGWTGKHGRHGEGSGMRLPLQGGLPPVDALPGAVVEIACDESGFSGTNLLHPATPVITHASVDLCVGEAVELIAALRSGFRFSPNEFKSGQFLRSPETGEAMQWLLAALGGRAHVHLVDKEYFLVTRIVDLLLAEPSYAAGTRLTQDQRPAALTLYRARRSAGSDWGVFLAAFVELVRIKRRHRPDRRALERFFHARDALVRDGLGTQAVSVLDGLSRTRVWAILTRLSDDDQSIPPPLEPMLPALAETVLFWSGRQRQVLVIHDEQSALTASRLSRLQQILADGAASSPADAAEAGTSPARRSPLAGLVMVDSRDDPRVQVADLLAGVARRMPGIVDDDPLQPLLSPTSLCDPER